MMQSRELQQRFSEIERTIHLAAQRCQQSQTVPTQLKDSIRELDQEAIHARNILNSQDENQIRTCVDNLEQLGDQARDACEQSTGTIDRELKGAVMQAHAELSRLKHQLH